jgi:predicted esterase
MSGPLEVAFGPAGGVERRRALLLLPGGAQTSEAFLQHLHVLDPHDRWLVAAAEPRLHSSVGPIWYNVAPAYDLDEVDESVLTVARAATRWLKRAKLTPDDLVIAGFSQGAVIASSLLAAPRVDLVPRGIGVLGGYALPRADLLDWSRLAGRQVLCAHGRDDVSIFASRGRELAESLRRHGACVRWRVTEGGHHLAPHLLGALRRWLAVIEDELDPSDPELREIPEPVPTIRLPDAPVWEAPD